MKRLATGAVIGFLAASKLGGWQTFLRRKEAEHRGERE